MDQTAITALHSKVQDALHVVAGALNSIQDDTTEVVEIGAQTLTGEQQKQVLENIGAAALSDVNALNASIQALTATLREHMDNAAAAAKADALPVVNLADEFVEKLTNPTIKASAQAALASLTPSSAPPSIG